MNSIPVALFTRLENAEPVFQKLAAKGLNPVHAEGPRLTKLWFVSNKKADVRVEVPANQYDQAMDLLVNWDAAEGGLSRAIRCPECASFRVDYPQYARHSLLTNLAMGILAALKVLEKDYYCEDCHFNWPREGFRAPRNKPNTAPYYFIEGIPQPAFGTSKVTNVARAEERKAA